MDSTYLRMYRVFPFYVALQKEILHFLVHYIRLTAFSYRFRLPVQNIIEEYIMIYYYGLMINVMLEDKFNLIRSEHFLQEYHCLLY